MEQWYSYVAGRQYGPAPWEALRGWAADGRVGPHDFVWTAGMEDWVRAASVEGLFDFPPRRSSVPYPSVSAPAPGGTDGRSPGGEVTSRARECLRGRWGLPVAFCLLLTLMQIAASKVPYVGWAASLFLTGPFTLGSAVFFLTFVRGGEGDLGMLFSGFRRYARALGTYLWMYLLILLWSLLGAVMGAIAGGLAALVLAATSGRSELVAASLIIGVAVGASILSVMASLSYSQTFYILCDRPDCCATEAVSRSREMMTGRKGKLFGLYLRFLGWGFLCIFTLFIGLLWLWPYMSTALAYFYEDLQPPRGQQAQAPGEPQPETPTGGEAGRTGDSPPAGA